MFENFGQSKLFIITKYIMVFLSLLFMAILSLFIIQQSDIKVPQKEVVIQLKFEDKSNKICFPEDEK